MNDSAPGSRAVNALEIEDVFVVSTTMRIDRDFNPTEEIAELAIGQRVEVDRNVMHQLRTFKNGTDEVNFVRYFVEADLRVLKPGVKPDAGELKDSDVLAEMNFVFAADYRCPADVPKDHAALGAFSTNAAFHVWPYVREAVHNACARMRLPRVTIPMLKPSSEQVRLATGNSETAPKER